MKEIVVDIENIAIVDDDDYNRLKEYKWHCYKDGYVRRSIKVDGKHRVQLMHRDVMNALKGTKIDHINRNKLDNRKCNLRFCNQSQNMANRIESVNKPSRYKGVTWDKHAKKWKATIGYHYKRIHLGLYDDVEMAKIVYRSYARRLFGKFAE